MDKVFFESINGKNIFCVFSELNSPQKRIVIMSHGFRGSSLGPNRTFIDFAKLLIEQGFSVLRFDQPNSGNSEGEFVDSSFNEWIATTEFFTKKYLDQNYQVILLGQSMGATTSMIVAAKQELKDKIRCILLWVPDPKSDVDVNPEQIYEEGGQKYLGKFWLEAKNADFMQSLQTYNGGIHLVYGENDKFITPDLRQKVIENIKQKGQSIKVLPGQDHSPWDFDIAQAVYKEQLEFIKKYVTSS